VVPDTSTYSACIRSYKVLDIAHRVLSLFTKLPAAHIVHTFVPLRIQESLGRPS